ncbi:MAG: CaiB/BaiF CoA-transferase family protein [Woeseiaceae bacterium]|nr:CaiB/BaiF CoA-transferase family protein [Woeseiaceae bacterium]
MGPLEGVTVIEMAGIGPAPVCGMLFADMGADVIVVDRATADGRVDALPDNARFAIHNRGKRTIAVDLKQSGGVDAVRRLVGSADALIESYRPGVMERVGLGPESCHEANPALVYGRLSGWGQDGPLSAAAGHDINYIAIAGALHASGPAGLPPSAPPTLVGDIGGGTLFLAVGMLAALLNARATGQGQVVDAAISDGVAAMTTLLAGLRAAGRWSGARGANLLDGGSHWYNVYECADGKYLSVGALEPPFYATLLERLGLADDPAFAQQYDPARWPAQRAALAELFLTRTRDDWCVVFEGSDACVAPVLDFDEASGHAHNRARKTWVDVDGVLQPAPAPRFSETPAAPVAAPPEPGQHTYEVLREAGFDADEIAALERQGAIARPSRRS